LVRLRLRGFLSRASHRGEFTSPTMQLIATGPPCPGKDRRRGRPPRPGLFADRSAKGGDVAVKGPDARRIAVSFARASPRIDGDQGSESLVSDLSAG
jgi:hypothetical protein